MDSILLISPTTCNYKLWTLYIKKKQEKTLHGGEKADWLGVSLSEESHSGVFLEFSFCLMYPRLGAGGDSVPEMPVSTDKNYAARNSCCLQGKKGGSPVRQKTFR